MCQITDSLFLFILTKWIVSMISRIHYNLHVALANFALPVASSFLHFLTPSYQYLEQLVFHFKLSEWKTLPYLSSMSSSRALAIEVEQMMLNEYVILLAIYLQHLDKFACLIKSIWARKLKLNSYSVVFSFCLFLSWATRFWKSFFASLYSSSA